jgi:hypothetical protein
VEEVEVEVEVEEEEYCQLMFPLTEVAGVVVVCHFLILLHLY